MDLGSRRMTTEARREQLLAFGRQHFAEHGYEAMPMDAIYGWVSLVENACAEWTVTAGASPTELVDFFISAFGPVLDVLQNEQRS